MDYIVLVVLSSFFLIGGAAGCFLVVVHDAHILDRWMFVVCVGGGFFKVVF